VQQRAFSRERYLELWNNPESPKISKALRVLCAPHLSSVRLAGFECMAYALLLFAFAAEGDESFALEVENVLLADELR